MSTGALRMRHKKAEDIVIPIDDVFMVPSDAILNYNTVNEIFQAGYSRIPVYEGDRSNVVNILHVRDIAFIDPDNRVPLKAALNTFNANLNEAFNSSDEVHSDSYDYIPHTANGDIADQVQAANHKPVEVSRSNAIHDQDPILRVENDMPLDILLQRFFEKQCHVGFVYRSGNDDYENNGTKELVGLVTLKDLFEEIVSRDISDEGDAPERNGCSLRRRRNEPNDFNRPSAISISSSLQVAAYQFLSSCEYMELSYRTR
jgi:metal transporter CNNM